MNILAGYLSAGRPKWEDLATLFLNRYKEQKLASGLVGSLLEWVADPGGFSLALGWGSLSMWERRRISLTPARERLRIPPGQRSPAKVAY